MKRITILSGKGGVGKSSITASLAILLSEKHKVICADCDVDASNLALVLGVKEGDFAKWEAISTNEKAEFDYDLCVSCQACLDACFFDAIDWRDDHPYLKDLKCEGCGTCELVCPVDAITLHEVNNAQVSYGKTAYDFLVVSGQLDMGESGSGKIVSQVKHLAEKQAENCDFMLVDAPAGIGCPVIAAISGSDCAIAVTEPTPSGFSDVKRALELADHFKIPCGLVINKYDINPDKTKEIEDFAKNRKLPLLAKIPYDRLFVQALVNLKPVIEEAPQMRPLFQSLSEEVLKIMKKGSKK